MNDTLPMPYNPLTIIPIGVDEFSKIMFAVRQAEALTYMQAGWTLYFTGEFWCATAMPITASGATPADAISNLVVTMGGLQHG